MGLTIAGTAPGAALVSISRSKGAAVDAVQPVAADRPPADHGLDANARGSGSNVVAASLLRRGGVPATASPEAEGPAAKPNLDALNRVLAHYIAQSQAAARLTL